MVSIPQSGFGAFEPDGPGCHPPGVSGVSIPQSGFGAFELGIHQVVGRGEKWFQSLSRDSGRLNSL